MIKIEVRLPPENPKHNRKLPLPCDSLPTSDVENDQANARTMIFVAEEQACFPHSWRSLRIACAQASISPKFWDIIIDMATGYKLAISARRDTLVGSLVVCLCVQMTD